MTKPTNSHQPTAPQRDDVATFDRPSADPLNFRAMALPDNEWFFLLNYVKHVQRHLTDLAAEPSPAVDVPVEWLRDRLVEAQLLIDFIEGPEFREGYLSWCRKVAALTQAPMSEDEIAMT